ncbi:SHOCT domain-containing protein [Lactococcus carnosus]|uniref:SHOCT domain-containing protein n=3 Tax=Pseudolactococcus carnosus TaxID=2749961 RepID=UPI0008123737|nr:SHOCT domain-containing protein [Lactococcus carnosus]SCA91066.1 conserved hypothetical protein [Lactococcus piscium]MCJ1970024.1 hypothetical protein [Lactococcus carnosus]MCJ1972759.1 hypothetical protein [Lactococcus carnosus]MCJ1975192.1 hypothetical protein [Lactococcus carnosus]MCJ1982012.1 hypothetical protein [Lactococcus carnosus]
MGFLDKVNSSFNDGIERRKQAKSDKRDYLAKNDILLKDFSKTGKAGAFGFNDAQQIIVLKQTPLSRAYAVRYASILSVRIDEQVQEVTTSNKKSKEKEKRKNVLGRSIVGTILMPGVGTVIGAATAKKVKSGNEDSTSTTSQNIIRKIIITREDPFMNTFDLPFSDSLFNKIQSILNNKIQDSKSDIFDSETMDKLLKLKTLLDEGILTKEEYESKKKLFLN